MDCASFAIAPGALLSRRSLVQAFAALGIGLGIPKRAGAFEFDQMQVELVWKATGSEEFPIVAPEGLALTADGSVHIVNAKRNQIVVVGPDGGFIDTWGEAGNEAGQFAFRGVDGSVIGDIDVDANGNIYVFDSFNYRVQKFSPDRTFQMEVTGDGTTDGAFSEVGGCVDQAGKRLIVADLSNHVTVFDLDGNLLWRIGEQGVEDGQFFWPFGVAVASDASIYVSEIKGKRIQKFDGEGRFLSRVASTGDEAAMVRDVYYLAVDAQDNLFVSDTMHRRIQIFGRDGAFIGLIDSVPGYGPFGAPTGIAVDAQGALYVGDGFEQCVLKLVLPTLR